MELMNKSLKKNRLTPDKEHLVLDNLNMIHFILNKQFHIHKYHVDYDDYFQQGCVGLILAAIRFDENLGFKFSTYAFPMVTGNIQRYKRDCESLIKYPRTLRDTIFKVLSLQSKGFTLEDIEQTTGISSKDIGDAINSMRTVSLSDTFGEDSDGKSLTIEDTLSCDQDDIEYIMSEENVLSAIQATKNSITGNNEKIYKDIWEEYIYGLMYGEKLGQQYFADKYNLSQAQVSRKLVAFKKEFVKQLGR